MTTGTGERLVVLLCGPPGAGKTTAAHQSGLTVYDRDDWQWTTETQFRSAIAQLATDPNAQAVVIRSGATSSARRKAADLIGATHCYMLTADPTELGHRIARRGRHDARNSLASLRTWFDTAELDDVEPFTGWDHIGTSNTTSTAADWDW